MSNKPATSLRPSASGFSGAAVSRREMLKCGAIGATSYFFADRLSQPVQADTPPAKAKAVIQIWMWGGPSHIDTFDPKPGAGEDYSGPLRRTLPTNVDGIEIGQSLPRLAENADKYSIIRSMTHGNNGHETAAYMVQTGRKDGDGVVYPNVGAVVSYFKGYDAGYKGLIPPYVVLTQPQGRFSEAGFLGSKYKPFATGGDPSRPRFVVEGVVAEGISDERQQWRRDLLGDLNTLAAAMKGDPRVDKLLACENEAYDMILGESRKIFDLTTESDELRERYGRSKFGQSCLMARRLVEAGVRYVTINYNGWDTHKKHFETMRQKLPELDNGFATLLEDLQDRGLLDSTIVWWGGEFGRTPKVDWHPPWNGGRGHYGACFSSVVAGGGFKGGQVLGESDARAEQVKDRPVYPWDMIGTMYQLLGIDPDGVLPHPQGHMVRVTPEPSEDMPSGGRLTEIT